MSDDLDLTDRRILVLLQQDAKLSIAEIADRVGLSPTPCWKRIKRLQDSGVLTGHVGLVDPWRVGLGLTVFVMIEIADHSPDARERFTKGLAEMPEVLEFYRIAGEIDYLLKVVVADMPAYDAFYARLTALAPLKGITSRLAMERLKFETALPIDTGGPWYGAPSVRTLPARRAVGNGKEHG